MPATSLRIFGEARPIRLADLETWLSILRGPGGAADLAAPGPTRPDSCPRCGAPVLIQSFGGAGLALMFEQRPRLGRRAAMPSLPMHLCHDLHGTWRHGLARFLAGFVGIAARDGLPTAIVAGEILDAMIRASRRQARHEEGGPDWNL